MFKDYPQQQRPNLYDQQNSFNSPYGSNNHGSTPPSQQRIQTLQYPPQGGSTQRPFGYNPQQQSVILYTLIQRLLVPKLRRTTVARPAIRIALSATTARDASKHSKTISLNDSSCRELCLSASNSSERM
jgi:hypothetical protein